jgi:hypothetical protein
MWPHCSEFVVSTGTETSMKGNFRRCISQKHFDDVPKLNGRDITFVNIVMYFGVTFDKRMTWRDNFERGKSRNDCAG